MLRRSSWTRWPLLVNGVLLTVIGMVYLIAEKSAHHLMVMKEHAQGNGIYDPTLHGDPLLVRPPDRLRMAVFALVLCTGIAHVLAGALYRSAPRGVLTALVIAGALSLAPTSLVFAVCTLIAVSRPRVAVAAPSFQ